MVSVLCLWGLLLGVGGGGWGRTQVESLNSSVCATVSLAQLGRGLYLCGVAGIQGRRSISALT